MGLNSTNDVFCARSDRVIVDEPKAKKIVDDILVCATTLSDLFAQIRRILTNCRTHHISISLKKLCIGPTIDFAGFTLSETGVVPDKSKLKAITDFPTPTNLSLIHI